MILSSAITRIDIALQNNPDSAEVWIALGNYYYSLGDYQDAASKFKRAIELDPESAEAVMQLSDTQFKIT